LKSISIELSANKYSILFFTSTLSQIGDGISLLSNNASVSSLKLDKEGLLIVRGDNLEGPVVGFNPN
jgi:hypothetical protein